MAKILPPIAEYLAAIGRKDPSSEKETHDDNRVFLEEIHHKFNVSNDLISHFLGNFEAAGEHIMSHVFEKAKLGSVASMIEDTGGAVHEESKALAAESATDNLEFGAAETQEDQPAGEGQPSAYEDVPSKQGKSYGKDAQ
jgi:hypothetical protein